MRILKPLTSIIEIEFFQPRYFMSYGQAYRETVDFMDFYNRFRLHGQLKWKTPMEIYELYKQGKESNMPAIKL